MCGICGFLTSRPISAALLERMNAQMAHRGPDDAGVYLGALGGVNLGIAHRRLSVLDVSALGHQPMFSEDRTVAIVYNGEIYNYRRMKKELQRIGYAFKGNCDTEVLLAAYREWGISFVSKCNGMFAFALVDFRTETVYFARDRLGQKPLYYYRRGGDFVFASELKPIMAFDGFEKKVRRDLLSRYLHHGYIAAPDTVFENTYKLLPGHVATWHAGKLKEAPYWDLLERRETLLRSAPPSYGEARATLKALIEDAVRARMIADVPLGAFLSGGVDSTLITAVAQSVSDRPVSTYTIGFSEDGYNEAPFAGEVAAHLKTDHHELYVDRANALEVLNDFVSYFDEPLADSSQIPTMLVSKFAREKLTVVLSGDAGDELFCGYSVYDKIYKLQHRAALIRLLSPLMRSHAKRLLPHSLLTAQQALTLCREAPAQFITEDVLCAARSLVLPDDLDCQKTVWYAREQSIPAEDLQERRTLLDMLTYLPDDIMAKVDRASMRYSLEARSPLLDYRVVEYALALPQAYKYKNRVKKYILKDILSDYVPRALFARAKQGFAIPIAEYLRESGAEFLKAQQNADTLAEQGLFSVPEAQALVTRFLDRQPVNERILWHYFVFQQWYHRFVHTLT